MASIIRLGSGAGRTLSAPPPLHEPNGVATSPAALHQLFGASVSKPPAMVFENSESMVGVPLKKQASDVGPSDQLKANRRLLVAVILGTLFVPAAGVDLSGSARESAERGLAISRPCQNGSAAPGSPQQ